MEKPVNNTTRKYFLKKPQDTKIKANIVSVLMVTRNAIIKKVDILATESQNKGLRLAERQKL